MKKSSRQIICASIILFSAVNVSAEGSLHHSTEASVHTSKALGHAIMSGVKVVSGVVAIPLKIVGEIGMVSGEAGDALWEEANGTIGESLELSDAVITAGPSPDKMINAKE
jgi:hypothetical protein